MSSWAKPTPGASRPTADDYRPSKRPRIDFKTSKAENVIAPKMSKEEQEMMDTLLSGLDGSVFDDYALSPEKSRAGSQKIRSPLKVTQARASQSITEVLRAAASKLPIKENRVLVEVDDSSRPISPLEKDRESEKTLADYDDYFLDFDMADLAALDDELLAAVPPPQIRYPIPHPDVPAPPLGYKSTPWIRCIVKHFVDGIHYQDGMFTETTPLVENPCGPGIPSGKTLIVQDVKSTKLIVVHLKDRWTDFSPAPEDTINLISPSLISPISISFKSSTSFIILHPDLMLTMTAIANAMPCPRKPILQSLIRIPGPSSKPILYGNLGHEILQGALGDQEFSAEKTEERLAEEMRKEGTRLEVWGAGLNMRDVQEEVGKMAGKGFQTFGERWVGPEPRVDGDLHSMPGDAQSLLSITGLHEIEEDIWSPKWGLKGKVDASVQASIILDRKAKNQPTAINVAPLEIKTGRSIGVMNHRAQTMLYTLLMEDRYGVPVPAGLLYYSQLDTILRVEARPNEIRSLITARNELASYLIKTRKLAAPPSTASPVKASQADVEESFLPPTIDSARDCKGCYAIDTCMLYRKTTDRVEVHEDDPIASLYEEKMGHMTEKDSEFFRKWENLLTVEEQDIGRLRKELWTMGAEEREKRGRCFGNMVIDSYTNDIGKSLAKIHRHTYTFARALGISSTTMPTNLLSGHITKGDPVNISIEPDLLCLQRGFIIDLTADHISIGVSYVIDTSALLKRTVHRVKVRETSKTDQLIFRIDKDEMAGGISKMRNNLAQLFFAGGDEKRRSLIVHNSEPRFDISLLPKPEEIPSSLNEDQASAMGKVLTAMDYALILGMPGTGKTTTIAEIIKALVARGKSVLLASYTHSAVDTILMKLVNESFGILRLGNIDKVHPDVQHLTLEAMNDSTSMGQLDERLMGPPVVATTCLSIDHPLFYKRKFDYCIIDEASQITLPTILGPLRFAETFVLVGDHYQLPPIVRNHEARKAGLDVSLFKMLSTQRPEAVVDLRYQYRMNEDIMSLSNTLIYDGRLRVGNEVVGKRGLILPNKKGCVGIKGAEAGCKGLETCWIQELLDESVKAVFVDTDELPAPDTRVGDLVQNPTEALLVRQLAGALISNGIREDDIAVITPYRQQIKVLNGLFKDKSRVEILTADKSQGRDKDVVLISLVRSNEVGNIGDLLRDWRRINVSFTRAKKKLVIFGSKRTLSNDRLLSDFLDLMERNKWIYTLRPGAEGLHPLEVGPESEAESKKTVETVRKVGKIGQAILSGNPFVKEIMKGGD